MHTPQVVGTPCWAAPEVLLGTTYDTKADVYSFGILLWEMAHLAMPYCDQPNLNINQIMFGVCHKGLRPTISPKCHPGLAQLIRKCWDADPRRRPTMEECVTILKSLN